VKRWVVVLAGGVGSRFWPLSTPERPKQLLPLVGDAPLLSEAVERLRPMADARHTMILTNSSLVKPIAALLPDFPPENIVGEPKPSGSAAALTWAANLIAQRDGDDAVMISVHADWAVGDPAGFRAVLDQAARAAETRHQLVTVGVVPTRPDPGFGYIQPADEVSPGVRRVARFVEKPDRERAEQMCRDGYLWNSGIFVWRVGDFLDEVRSHAPEVAPALERHSRDIAAFFGSVKPIAVDHGVLERSSRILVLRGDFGWDDVGTWGALRRVRAKDASGNALGGDADGGAHAVASSGNVVHAEDTTVVLYGVQDLVVVARPGLVLVTTVDKSSDLKSLIEQLPESVLNAK
jgi:mannose-1-phosphate guanylyltransferase